MTIEQRELIKKLYEELLKEEEHECKINSSNIKLKQKIQLGDFTWSAFAKEENGDTYFLLDKEFAIKNEKFGNDNNYINSNYRRISINCAQSQKALEVLGKNAFNSLEIDLLSHDGLRDYGICKGDLFGIMNFDVYRNNRENIDFSHMPLSTPHSTPSGSGASFVQYVGSGGDVGCVGCVFGVAVRPFFILKSNIFVSLVK